MLQNERFERFLNGLSKKTAQKPLNWGTLRGVRWGGGGGVYVGGGVCLGPRPGKTAQKPLKFCLKNRSKITARNERFLSGFLSKI